MKTILISDTHGRHHELDVPNGDMIIHSGDLSFSGDLNMTLSFLDWYSKLPHKHKIFIAGNHDFLFEDQPKAIEKSIPDNLIYLNDSGVEIEGLKVWGSPVQPWFGGWAFNRRKEDIVDHWVKMPSDIDILVTHGPPKGILDRVGSQNTGCPHLLEKVKEVKPIIHAFGHIHIGYGQLERHDIKFYNAACVDSQYRIKNKATEVNL